MAARKSDASTHTDTDLTTPTPLQIAYSPSLKQLTLVIYPGTIIRRALLAAALNLIRDEVDSCLRQYGRDKQLSDKSDPLPVTTTEGVEVTMRSNRRARRHLTFGIMAEAVQGLIDVLLE